MSAPAAISGGHSLQAETARATQSGPRRKGSRMASRISPLGVGDSPDPEVNQLLADGRDGWWEDAAMFGVIGRNPQMLKAIIPVFGSLFAEGAIEPHIHEMMRLKTGQINDCAY